MVAQTALEPAQPQPVALSPADTLVAALSNWHPHPTKVKVLIERAKDRLASNKEVATRAGIGLCHLSQMRHGSDATFAQLYEGAMYDERVAVLLLAALTIRGAHATLYDAVNGTKVQRAQVIAAQTVIEAATRRHQQREHDPLPSLDT